MTEPKTLPDGRKLFTVGVTIEFDMVVLAKDTDEAVRVARSDYWDELRDQDFAPEFGHPYVVRRRSDIGCMTDEDLEAIPPYGERVDGEVPEDSIAEYMNALGIQR